MLHCAQKVRATNTNFQSLPTSSNSPFAIPIFSVLSPSLLVILIFLKKLHVVLFFIIKLIFPSYSCLLYLPPKHAVMAVIIFFFFVLHLYTLLFSLVLFYLLYLQLISFHSSRNARASKFSHLPFGQLPTVPAGISPWSLQPIPVQECLHKQHYRVSLIFISQQLQ